MSYNNYNDRNQTRKVCDCQNDPVYDKKKKHKSQNLPPLRKYDHDIFNCPFMQAPEKDKVQYLYADPCFIRQATRRERAGYNKEVQDEDKFYDCEGDSLVDLQRDQKQHNIAHVINNIQNPKEFKCLLKEVATTSQILYRCFSRAYHKAKKSTTSPKGVSKKHEKRAKCVKCLQRCREKSQKETGLKPCDKMRTCDYPPQATVILEDENSKDLLVCDNADCDCPKEHKKTSQGLTKHTTGQNKKLCGNTLNSVINLNGFEVFKLCPSSDFEYKDMSFCEKCARLRGEPVAAGQLIKKISKEIVPLSAVSSIFRSIKDSAMGGAEIIRCPEKSSAKNKPHEIDTNLVADKSGAQIVSSDTIPKPAAIVTDTDSVIKSSQRAVTTALKTTTMNDKQCEECQQFPTQCRCAEHLNVDATTNSSRCPCFRHQPKVSSTTRCSQPSTNPPHSLCPTFQAQRTCPCHRRNHSLRIPTKHKPPSRCHHDKSNNVHMQPIAFTLPINLQIQTRSGETRFFQTEIQMEASAEAQKLLPKSKPKSYTAEPIRTATIAAATSASQTQTENAFRFQQEAELGGTVISGDVFYSCSTSTSSMVDIIPSHPDKPCEALLEIFEIIKKRVNNNKNVPSRIIKDLAEFDINECIKQKTNSPTLTPPLYIPEKVLFPELTPPSKSSEPPKSVGTENPKPVANLETQTEPLPIERSSSKSLARVSSPGQFIEESLNKAKIPTVEPLLYHQGSGCFDIRLTNRPRHQPPTNLLQEVINDLEQKSKTNGRPTIIESLSEEDINKIKDMPTEDSTKPEVRTLDASITEQTSDAKLKPPEHPTSITSILPVTPPTPPSPPPPYSTPALASRMSVDAQTDILSSSAYSHLKRNDMRKEIMENLEELVKPTTSNTKNKYDPDERIEILRDLHKLFTPKRAAGQVPKDESRHSVLEDIQLLLNPRDMRKTMSSSTIITGKHKSKSNLRKTRSTEVILKDIRHVLNPKGGEKPSKRFTSDHREHVLEHLHNLLTPRSKKNTKPEPGTRDSILQDLRFMLDTPNIDNSNYLPKPPKPPIKPKPHRETTNVKPTSDDFRILENNQRHKSEILDNPKSVNSKKDLQLELESSSEDVTAPPETSRPHTSQQAPPTAKKPKPKSSRPIDENESKTHKVDNSELIPSSQGRNPTDQIVTTQMDDGISLVSTSSDTFFINLDDNLSDAYPPRPSSFLRRSQYYHNTVQEESSCDHELRNDEDLKKLCLDKSLETKKHLPSGSRYTTDVQDITSKLNVNMEATDQQKLYISQNLQSNTTDNKANVVYDSRLNTRSSPSQKRHPLKTSFPATSTSENRSQNRNPLTISPLRGSTNLIPRHQSVRIQSQEDFRPFNRKYEKRLTSERNSVVVRNKRKSVKSLDNNEETVKRPGSLGTENRQQHKLNASGDEKNQNCRRKKSKQPLKSIENL